MANTKETRNLLAYLGSVPADAVIITLAPSDDYALRTCSDPRLGWRNHHPERLTTYRFGGIPVAIGERRAYVMPGGAVFA